MSFTTSSSDCEKQGKLPPLDGKYKDFFEHEFAEMNACLVDEDLLLKKIVGVCSIFQSALGSVYAALQKMSLTCNSTEKVSQT